MAPAVFPRRTAPPPSLLLALLLASSSPLRASGVALAPAGVSQRADWLVRFRADLVSSAAETTVAAPGGGSRRALRLSNGLLTRTFVLDPCFATVDLTLHSSRTQFVRALSPAQERAARAQVARLLLGAAKKEEEEGEGVDGK